MAPSSNTKFSTTFTSLWPNKGSKDDPDYTDDCQPDICTDESIMSGNEQVIAKGCVACAADSNYEDKSGEEEDAAANDKATMDEKGGSGKEGYDARSLYTTMIPKSSLAQDQRCHSQCSQMSS